MNEQLADPVREVLAFYADEYSEARFPEVDVDILAAALSEVEAAAAEVNAALEIVERRKAVLAGLESDLLRKVSRAIAFLKVHVDGDEGSYSKLDALNQALISNTTTHRAGHGGKSGGARRTRTREPSELSSASEHATQAPPSVSDERAPALASG